MALKFQKFTMSFLKLQVAISRGPILLYVQGSSETDSDFKIIGSNLIFLTASNNSQLLIRNGIVAVILTTKC